MEVLDVIKPIGDSLIGWLGGKTTLRPTIINCMPRHKCYVEVFAGSATVFFGKPSSRNEIINDVHSELVNLMKVVSGTYFDESIRQEFIGYVRSMPASREVYEDWKRWDKDKIAELTISQRAFRFYYCVKKGFSSIPKGGYEASPLSSNRYNMNTNFDKFSSRFRQTNAQIENMDFVDLIEKYNRATADTFFFADPPYFVAGSTNYYEFIFTKEQHNQLKACCDKIDENNNTFMLTYDDVPQVLELYKDYYIYRTDPIIYRSSDERGKRELVKTELFITNYDIAKMVHERNVKPEKGRQMDIFDEGITVNDKKINVPDHIGLERIN